MRAVGSAASPMRYRLLGCPLDVLWPEQILSLVHRAIRTGDTVRVEGLNVAKVIQARRDHALMAALEEAEIVHLDGVGIALGGRLLGYRMPPRRGGCDLMLDLMGQAVRERYRVYFLGATQEVVSELADKLRNCFPGLQVAGTRDGYFGPDEEVAVVDEIRSKRVDLLFVGISSPKKELFIRRWWRALEVKASVGVGGAFDVLSGRVRRAPLYVQRVGLEWLFRLCLEPRRLMCRYLFTNTIFAALLVREALGLNTDRSVRANGSRPYYD